MAVVNTHSFVGQPVSTNSFWKSDSQFTCSGQGQCQYGMWIGPEVLGSDISRLALSPPPMTTLTTAGRIPTKNCAGANMGAAEQILKMCRIKI